jgi:hypothetical protein
MAVNWITPAGSLGIITERISLEIPLQVTSPTGPVTFTILAGALPRGLRLDGNTIKGSPVEVVKFTESRFVIRANNGTDIDDRTFSLSVDGADLPSWVTKEGFLNVGPNDAYYVLDNSYIDFQLEANDNDTIAGDVLEYYISPMDGELPPGLTLSRSGRIYGFTDPIFAVENQTNYTGGYDTSAFDVLPLDKAEAQSSGFDDYLYDLLTYDYSEESKTPRRLSRFYTFLATVTDGKSQVKRLFKIYVVTEEFLKSDNTIVQVDTNVFQASSSSNRSPLWVTESNLGRVRANNYLTIFLEVYRAPGISGTLLFFLQDKNPDGSNSVLPSGLSLDQITGEIAGKVPYQRAVTISNQFTVLAANFLVDILTLDYNLRGAWSVLATYAKNDAVLYNNILWICVQPHQSRQPNEQPLYWNSSAALSEKTFTIDLIGEIESYIEWVSNSDLGTIRANMPSSISVLATGLTPGDKVLFEVTNGSLPPGLTLSGTGNIQGKVKQFADSNGLGLTRFFDWINDTHDSSGAITYSTSFDGSNTTFDKEFRFEITARDTIRFAESKKTFSLRVINENVKTFSNLYIKSFQNKTKRLAWFNFITDSNIFRSDEIYRYGDTNFGVQVELKVLLFAGIESVEAVNYVQSMSRNHARKRIRFGDVKSAKAKDPITQETLYEIIYVDIVDPLEKNRVSISQTVQLPDKINSKVLVSYNNLTVDSDIPFVSDSDKQRVFPNSIKNMRKRIQSIGEYDRSYLPLWMRSIQENSLTEPGYVKALPLCYTLPGKSAAIISRIKFSDFDFKNIDLEADRYIIDVIDGTFQDKYLAFPTGTASRSIDDPLPPAAPDTPTPAQPNPFSMDSLVTTNDSLSITYDQGY